MRDDLVPEEFGRPPSFVTDDKTLLPTPLDLEDFHHGTITRFDIPEDILIDFEGIFRGFFEENGVRNGFDVGFPVNSLERGNIETRFN